MREHKLFKAFSVSLLFVFLFTLGVQAQNRPAPTDEEQFLKAFHGIQSQTLLEYVEELCTEKYAGRLCGTEEYKLSAEWVISFLKKWGVGPGGDNGTYYQNFPNPYTVVLPGCEVSLNLPVEDAVIKKYYTFEDEYIPGATSGSGEVTAEVVYVGYGITAPELGYDEYAGLDVRGKIVLMERESPVGPNKPDEFKKWRPYSFHQYKHENAYKHGAKGMLYNYGPIANPNNAYREDFIYSHVGDVVVADIFAGTGIDHAEVVKKIAETLKPQSFITGKVATIKNITTHYPDGIGFNVIGTIPGSDPVLKDEVIIVGGHLDFMGKCPEFMAGANDNAAAVAVMLGVAEAMMNSPYKPKRSVQFNFFGAEEQGVAGSDFYVENPIFPLEKTAAMLNMDGVGIGDRLNAGSGKNYPKLFEFIDRANQQYVHRIVRDSFNSNLGRQRQDAAHFLWKGVPTISFGASGIRIPYPTYHNTRDVPALITPEIMESLAQILFVAITDMADEVTLNLR
ncbi:MAG: M28 family peptidase [Acidobacteriota bacterium]